MGNPGERGWNGDPSGFLVIVWRHTCSAMLLLGKYSDRMGQGRLAI